MILERKLLLFVLDYEADLCTVRVDDGLLWCLGMVSLG